MTDEQKDAAKELRRVREEVRRKALLTGPPGLDLPAPAPLREPEPVPREQTPAPETPPLPPDTTAVNESWRVEVSPPGGLKGFVFRFLDRIFGPRFDAQRTFNAHQVQLNNELLRYLDERFAATHRHYDQILGMYGRHLGEVDERHMIIQEELVVHVEDLIKRIDVVLASSERGQLSLEHELRDLRRRLERIEASLDYSGSR